MTARQPSDLLSRMPAAVAGSISAADIRDIVDTLAARTALSPAEFGAVGNGVADDTAALQSAVDAAFASGRPLHVPAGHYKVTASIVLPGELVNGTPGPGLCVYGDGESTQVLHAFAGRLFTCSATLPTFMEFRRFKVVSTTAKAAADHVFYFGGGIAKAVFSDIRIGPGVADAENPDNPGTPADQTANLPAGLFDCAPGSITDTVIFRECYLERVKGRGYGIGKGSSVWWYGGRIIGNDRVNGVGVHLHGGNGGVYVDGLDIINIGVGMRVSQDNGEGNREVFIKQSCFDSCNIGLWMLDGSYTEIEGLWAASCDEANVLLDATYTGIFTVSGGTVFSAGVFNAGGNKNGCVVNGAGLAKFDNVIFRNNVGAGIACTVSGKPSNAEVSGCTFYGNAVGMSTSGQWEIVGNTFYSNTANLVENPGSNNRIINNLGLNPGGAMAAPAVPASGATHTYSGAYPVDVYVSGGTVSGVWVNGGRVHVASNVTVHLDKGGTIRLDYTAAPTWAWVRR